MAACWADDRCAVNRWLQHVRFQPRFRRGGTRFAWTDRESKAPLDHLEAGLACLALASTPLLIYGLPLPLGVLAVSVAALCVVVLARAGYTRFTVDRG